MRNKKLHLPDCSALRERLHKDCDCGRPPHPLPALKELIRDEEGRLKVIKRRKDTK